VITELAVIEPSDQGLVLKERAPGVTVEKVMAATEASLIIPSTVPEMAALERRA
jgi:acetate CoA/acetoacetate CoA-transferase beta subunit